MKNKKIVCDRNAFIDCANGVIVSVIQKGHEKLIEEDTDDNE